MSIQAKGDEEISTYLNYSNPNKHQGYNYYYIDLKDNKFNYNKTINFRVNGTIDDLINIGVFIFDDNDTSLTVIDSNIEISGYFNIHIADKHCFQFKKKMNQRQIILLLLMMIIKILLQKKLIMIKIF